MIEKTIKDEHVFELEQEFARHQLAELDRCIAKAKSLVGEEAEDKKNDARRGRDLRDFISLAETTLKNLGNLDNRKMTLNRLIFRAHELGMQEKI